MKTDINFFRNHQNEMWIYNDEISGWRVYETSDEYCLMHISQTKLRLNIRLKENKNCVKLGDNRSAIIVVSNTFSTCRRFNNYHKQTIILKDLRCYFRNAKFKQISEWFIRFFQLIAIFVAICLIHAYLTLQRWFCFISFSIWFWRI